MGCTDTKEIVEARIHHLNYLYDNLEVEIAAEKRKLEEKGYVPPINPEAPVERVYKKKRRQKGLDQIEGKNRRKKFQDDYLTGSYYYNQALNKKKNMYCSDVYSNGFDFDDLDNPIGNKSINEEALHR